jgi:hypothetical protein
VKNEGLFLGLLNRAFSPKYGAELNDKTGKEEASCDGVFINT